MDRLDRFSIWAIVILLISSSALISYHTGEARPEYKNQQRAAASSNTVVNDEVANKSRIIRGLIEGNNLDKAEIIVKEMIDRYPYEGEPHMLMGDIYMRRQELIKAVFEYKEAVELDPDYLDKKTPLFQGKKLKMAVKEALEEIEKGIDANPDDEVMRKNRRVIYYLQRRIAGSCG